MQPIWFHGLVWAELSQVIPDLILIYNWQLFSLNHFPKHRGLGDILGEDWEKESIEYFCHTCLLSLSHLHHSSNRFTFSLLTFLILITLLPAHLITCDTPSKPQLHFSFGFSDTIPTCPSNVFTFFLCSPSLLSPSVYCPFALSSITASLLTQIGLLICLFAQWRNSVHAVLPWINLLFINYHFFGTGLFNTGEYVRIEIFHRHLIESM